MIPVALLLTIIGVAVASFAVKILWEAHTQAGKAVALEKKVDGLREALDDLLIGNVPKEDIRALLRRYFDSKR
jgi:hypothetical protein